jgi:CpeS-like protein
MSDNETFLNKYDIKSLLNLKNMHIDIPKNMMEFFLKSEGTWLTQRTVHHFEAVTEDQSGESNLSVQVLAADHPQVQAVCVQQGIDPAKARGGASFGWQDNQDKQALDPDRAAILVDIPTDDSLQSGKLLRNQGYVEKIPVVSRYWFGRDGILTIDTDYDSNQGQERCWFIHHDFRVRVSTVRNNNGVHIMTYCSERRCVGAAELDRMIVLNAARQ